MVLIAWIVVQDNMRLKVDSQNARIVTLELTTLKMVPLHFVKNVKVVNIKLSRVKIVVKNVQLDSMHNSASKAHVRNVLLASSGRAKLPSLSHARNALQDGPNKARKKPHVIGVHLEHG